MNNTPEQSEDQNKSEIVPAEQPKVQVHQFIRELELMAMSKANPSGLDLSKLDREQVNALLEGAKEHESNAFAYHTLKLNVSRDIKMKEIEASIVNQKTIRYLLWFGILGVAPVTIIGMTILFMFYKPEFLSHWFTLITGLLGGAGLTKIMSGLLDQTKVESSPPPTEEDEE